MTAIVRVVVIAPARVTHSLRLAHALLRSSFICALTHCLLLRCAVLQLMSRDEVGQFADRGCPKKASYLDRRKGPYGRIGIGRGRKRARTKRTEAEAKDSTGTLASHTLHCTALILAEPPTTDTVHVM